MEEIMIDKASKTTLTVQDGEGRHHIIHSDELGIAELLDVMAKAGPDAIDAKRYNWLKAQNDKSGCGWCIVNDALNSGAVLGSDEIDELIDTDMLAELSAA